MTKSVLITYGGTQIDIDDVRRITNLSKGTFGSKLTNEFLLWHPDYIVHTLRAVNSVPPIQADMVALTEHFYRTFEEYQETLQNLLNENMYDIVILNAAVSDYTVDKQEGKISSKEDINISLKKTPKIIDGIRYKCSSDCYIVGFKLLVNSHGQEIYQRSFELLTDSGVDMVVGNNLDEIKNGFHTLYPMYVIDDTLDKTSIRYEFIFPQYTSGIPVHEKLVDMIIQNCEKYGPKSFMSGADMHRTDIRKLYDITKQNRHKQAYAKGEIK